MDTDDYFIHAEVARRLRVDYTTVMRWIRTGLIDVETITEGRRNRHRMKKSVIEAIERRDPELHKKLVYTNEEHSSIMTRRFRKYGMLPPGTPLISLRGENGRSWKN